jgi:hypothetical protein
MAKSRQNTPEIGEIGATNSPTPPAFRLATNSVDECYLLSVDRQDRRCSIVSGQAY